MFESRDYSNCDVVDTWQVTITMLSSSDSFPSWSLKKTNIQSTKPPTPMFANESKVSTSEPQYMLCAVVYMQLLFPKNAFVGKLHFKVGYIQIMKAWKAQQKYG